VPDDKDPRINGMSRPRQKKYANKEILNPQKTLRFSILNEVDA